MSSGVYAIRHAPSGRAYIGSSKDVLRRWRAHVAALNRGKHHAVALSAYWLADGSTAFTFSILEGCPVEDLAEREQEWLDLQSSPLNNSRIVKGVAFDPVIAAKISATKKGKNPNPEHASAMGRSNKGKIRSLEHQAKLNAAHRGKIRSAETRQRIREGMARPEARAKFMAHHWSRTLKRDAVIAKVRQTKENLKIV